MSAQTADLCDAHAVVRVVAPMFRSYGKLARFAGRISTVSVHEDNVLVRDALSAVGHGRVLVVDGGGSLRCALLGDNLAQMAHDQGWAGLIVHGCIRDSAAVASIAVGVLALATHPRKSAKRGAGERDVPVTFGGVTFTPGEHVYVDEDGVVVSERALP